MTARYRNNLPQTQGNLFLTDGGLETTLVFHDGFDLPHFAAFDLFKNEEGRERLHNYFMAYVNIAREQGIGFILESPTWRASSDWGQQIGYSSEELDRINRQSIDMLVDIRNEYATDDTPMVISGCLGPRGDGYNPASMMTADEAEAYHTEQIKTFAETDADMVTAFTITYIAEAIGLTRAAQAQGIPIVISFTLETDGALPSGETLKEAILTVDEATNQGPTYYMLNCAHPTHFEHVISTDETWLTRIKALRANASCLSHTELDESEVLDEGNPQELAQQYTGLTQYLTGLTVVGGCCGTDHRHVEAICKDMLQATPESL